MLNLVRHTREADRVIEGMERRWEERLWKPFIPDWAHIKESYTGYRTRCGSSAHPRHGKPPRCSTPIWPLP